MQLVRTSSLKDEYRTIKLFISHADFDKCEYCKSDLKNNYEVSAKYYHRHGLVLCDRCIDKIQNSNSWSDEYAKSNNLKPFPNKPNPEIILKNHQEEQEYKMKAHFRR